MICRNPHELPFGTQALKEENEFQLEKDHRIDGGAPMLHVAVLDSVADEGEVKGPLQTAVEVVWGNELLE
jgi:hypothetical protein